MNDKTSSSSFKRKIGYAAFVIASMQVLVSMIMLIAPKQVVNSNVVSSLYSRLVLLGPFFQEARIKTSPHLYVSYKVDGLWSPIIDNGKMNFEFYCSHPWRYDKLHYSDFERFLTLQISRQGKSKDFEKVQGSKAFRELNQYLLREHINVPVDSVCLVYGLNAYVLAEKKARFDTLFNYTYNPNAIAPSKTP